MPGCLSALRGGTGGCGGSVAAVNTQANRTDGGVPREKLVLGVDASRAASRRPTGTETYAARVIGELLSTCNFRLRLYLRRGDAAPADWE